MKEESNKLRLVEMRRAKEVAQLQKDARVREVELRSLKQDKQKRDIVLKRKQEENQALRRLQKPTSGSVGRRQNGVVAVLTSAEKTFSAKAKVAPGSGALGCESPDAESCESPDAESCESPDRDSSSRVHGPWVWTAVCSSL